MTKVLRIDSSILGQDSVSRLLLDELQHRLAQRQGPLFVTVRDFAVRPVPHLDQTRLQALLTPEKERSEEQQVSVLYSDTLIKELQDADVLLLALPMYNFSVPSMLKAWQDHVARAGVTFRYTEQGAEGLLTGKRAYLVATMGGIHEAGGSDYLRPVMQHFLGFLGITDIHIITADGLNMGEMAREKGIAAARREIDNLTGTEAVDAHGEEAA